ncbi:MAG TPA: hypothetical protein VNG93_02895 [Candidatus Dormibacteraeota bacterium]|nr:hypothetical protein [Candidatus Dormibacteraeota bacterium]
MPLDHLRTAYLADARREAEAQLTAARAQAASLLEGTRREADQVLDKARTESVAAVEAEARRESAIARRDTTRLFLTARAEGEKALRGQVLEAVQSDPRLPELRAGLEAAARSVLDAGCKIELVPDGGIRARDRDRLVDYSMASIVDRCLADSDLLPEEVSQ